MTTTHTTATTWHKGLLHWTEGNEAFLSVVFSWDLVQAYTTAAWYKSQGYHVRAGGPAVILNPGYLADLATVNGDKIPVLHRFNPEATVTSRGCIRACPFCAVPRIEGPLRELGDDDWEPKRVICDNNLLACSLHHFDHVIDRLKPIEGVDFNDALDARLLTDHHAQRIAELDIHKVRLSWDSVGLENQVAAAVQRLRKAGIHKHAISIYCLIGFQDTIQDARYRLETCKWKWGINPVPMRYQPLDTPQRNSYVAPGWTDYELRRLVRYWWRTRWLAGIPYDEFRPEHRPSRSNTATTPAKQTTATLADPVTPPPPPRPPKPPRPKTEIPDGYCRIKEAAAQATCNPKTVYKWIKARRVRTFQATAIYVNLADVVAARQRDRISQRVPTLPPTDMITINQAAAITGISRSTILYRAKHGLIPSQRYGALWYVDPDRLDIDPVKKDAQDGE